MIDVSRSQISSEGRIWQVQHVKSDCHERCKYISEQNRQKNDDVKIDKIQLDLQSRILWQLTADI